MNPIVWLNPGRWLLIVGIVAAVAIGAPILKARYDVGQQRIGYERRAGEDKAAAEIQAARMRELARAAELRYTVQAEARERVITETIVEVRHVAKPLASCPVPPDAVRLLNRARECASGDRSSACGADGGLPDSGAAPVGSNGAGAR